MSKTKQEPAAEEAAESFIVWTGKGSSVFFDRERPEIAALGLSIDLTLTRGEACRVGTRAGECPPQLAEQLVQDGRAVYSTEKGRALPEQPTEEAEQEAREFNREQRKAAREEAAAASSDDASAAAAPAPAPAEENRPQEG